MMIPVFEQAKTFHALDHAAIVIGILLRSVIQFYRLYLDKPENKQRYTRSMCFQNSVTLCTFSSVLHADEFVHCRVT
jgi:hypothetical protein